MSNAGVYLYWLIQYRLFKPWESVMGHPAFSSRTCRKFWKDIQKNIDQRSRISTIEVFLSKPALAVND
jgi:hypothetical protein